MNLAELAEAAKAEFWRTPSYEDGPKDTLFPNLPLIAAVTATEQLVQDVPQAAALCVELAENEAAGGPVQVSQFEWQPEAKTVLDYLVFLIHESVAKLLEADPAIRAEAEARRRSYA